MKSYENEIKEVFDEVVSLNSSRSHFDLCISEGININGGWEQSDGKYALGQSRGNALVDLDGMPGCYFTIDSLCDVQGLEGKMLAKWSKPEK